eukprot:8741933-Pyramimonas_sp.AAC.1
MLDGGRRTVGIFPGAIRPLTRWLRSTTGSRWADLNKRSYIFGAEGQGCEACAWRQAAAGSGPR